MLRSALLRAVPAKNCRRVVDGSVAACGRPVTCRVIENAGRCSTTPPSVNLGSALDIGYDFDFDSSPTLEAILAAATGRTP